jgi:hypothetical protein
MAAETDGIPLMVARSPVAESAAFEATACLLRAPDASIRVIEKDR